MYQLAHPNPMPLDRWLAFTRLINEVRSEPKHLAEIAMLRKEWGKAVRMYAHVLKNGYHHVN